jgi:hypothetical protein
VHPKDLPANKPEYEGKKAELARAVLAREEAAKELEQLRQVRQQEVRARIEQDINMVRQKLRLLESTQRKRGQCTLEQVYER